MIAPLRPLICAVTLCLALVAGAPAAADDKDPEQTPPDSETSTSTTPAPTPPATPKNLDKPGTPAAPGTAGGGEPPLTPAQEFRRDQLRKDLLIRGIPEEQIDRYNRACNRAARAKPTAAPDVPFCDEIRAKIGLEYEPRAPTAEELKAQFEKYCKGTPTRNNQSFCETYLKEAGATGTTTTPTPVEKTEYAKHCRGKNGSGYQKYCRDYEKDYPKAAAAATATRPVSTTADNDEPDSGPLAFTGLDIWQLVALGLVLVAGGLGVRRVLAT